MNDIAVPVQKYISIMTVLHLQKVRQNRVSSQTLHEILLSHRWIRINLIEELPQSHIARLDLFKQPIQSCHVVEHLNQSAVGT